MYAQAPTPVRSVRPYYELKVRDEKVADMELDMVADMVADIVADKKWPTWWLTKKTWLTKRQQQRQRQKIQLENTTKEGFLKTFKEHHQMAILEKFWVWPLIHCYEFRPFQTKLMGVDQISPFQPKVKILEYLEYLELGQFRNFCDVFTLFVDIFYHLCCLILLFYLFYFI